MSLANPADAGGPRQPSHRLSEVLGLYPLVRDDHLRTLQKCGLIEPPCVVDGERFIGFADVAVLRQVNAEIQRGASFRAVLRSFVASRSGQLALDFRVDAQPAKVLSLDRPPAAMFEHVLPERAAPVGGGGAGDDGALAEQYFALGSSLDDGSADKREEAAAAYRSALAIDPRLVPALINLANIHYAQDHLAEAMALYERAIGLEPDIFEGHFNLGNIHHDLGRYGAAEACYRQALAVNPRYAEAHLYLAVVLEKDRRSQDAKPHWRAYLAIAPHGEWAELAREFSE